MFKFYYEFLGCVLLAMCLAMEESISMLELMRVKESAMMDAVGRLSISFLIFCRCLSCVLDCECSYLMQLASS